MNKLISELTRLRAENERLREALQMAVRQNEHDMLMTGDECREARAALAKEPK
jgi:regulator of replication initiation timing